MSEPRFWRLREPAADDYQRVRRNGAVRYAYALPTTGCRTCARMRDSGRVLLTACPPEWRERLQPRRGREHRVTNAEFAELRAELEPALGPDGVRDMLPLEPGDRFSPALWRVSSRPEDDVLWPELGAALVSDRVRAAFEREGVTGARFSAVTPERVGRASPRRAPRTLRGEPEDALRRIPARSGDGAAATGAPAYWRLGVSATSTLPPSYDPAGLCPECGRPDRGRAPYPAAFQPAMWGGDDVFYLAHTLYVVVTDRVRALLENMSATNVVFEPAASPLPHV